MENKPDLEHFKADIKNKIFIATSEGTSFGVLSNWGKKKKEGLIALCNVRDEIIEDSYKLLERVYRQGYKDSQEGKVRIESIIMSVHADAIDKALKKQFELGKQSAIDKLSEVIKGE